ncbi:MAG: hypothetical protein COA42_24485 [Alteromonadaceae bacterium]|nr:MAG: hypothetical protein COA42_24485 [Alteromonadaceae bacterium]
MKIGSRKFQLLANLAILLLANFISTALADNPPHSESTSDSQQVTEQQVTEQQTVSQTTEAGKPYTAVGHYTYNCYCGEKPSGGAFSTGVCYPPGDVVHEPNNIHYTFPNFTIDSSSTPYPNANTQNGYEFEFYGYNEILLYFNCNSGKIGSVRIDKEHKINCDSTSNKNYKKKDCRNNADDKNHFDIQNYQCKCAN